MLWCITSLKVMHFTVQFCAIQQFESTGSEEKKGQWAFITLCLL
jgi:hypothetical protein